MRAKKTGRGARAATRGPERRRLPKGPVLERLPPLLREAIGAARRLARDEGRPLFLAGGAVRDLLLGRPVLDLDLIVEGDAPSFARRLGSALNAEPRVHPRFGTATLSLPGGVRLDLAASRRETYERPGALPRVEPASIREDLERRDFTINALALEIAPRSRLLDPFGGQADLEKGIVRMLHPGSPRDDPTRACRAVRYANRLGFRIEPRTRRWIVEASRGGVFDAISGDRLRRELRLLFSEANRAGALRLMTGLGLDTALDPALARAPSALRAFARAERVAERHPGRTSWLLYLLVWTAGLGAGDTLRLSRRLALAGEEGRRVRSWPAAWKEIQTDPVRATPSRLLSRGLSGDEIAAAAARLPAPAGRRLERALTALDIRLSIGGRDLIAAGVPAGPRIGRALEAALAARRDGKIVPGQELPFALAAARRRMA
jgi:tRNA nucleotidyltransferase (CCA-adding enzyme)